MEDRYNKMHQLYKEGYSLEKVGNVFGVTRQSVYSAFKKRGFKMRSLKKKPFIEVDDLKFTINRDGYYECTTKDRLMLHNYIYEKHNGPIKHPNVIHHIDHNKINNDISNLVELSPSEHSLLHNRISGWNGMSKRILRVETGEIFNSIVEVAKIHNQHASNVSRYYIDGGRKLDGFTYTKMDD